MTTVQKRDIREKMLAIHITRAHFVQACGMGATRLIGLVRRVPMTTDGTRLKTALSLTSARISATDDGDSMGATSTDDESDSALSMDMMTSNAISRTISVIIMLFPL